MAFALSANSSRSCLATDLLFVLYISMYPRKSTKSFALEVALLMITSPQQQPFVELNLLP